MHSADTMRIARLRMVMVLGSLLFVFLVQPSRASPCSLDIDRAWVHINAQIRARIAAGRSAPQSTVALLHHQPTGSSVAAAEDTLVDMWVPFETAVAALARARQADRANDGIACQAALANAERLIAR
jgi:hypothetical protein